MTLDDVPLFATLKSRLSYLADRQQVISQNVANTDTPGFTPSDMKPFTLPGQGGAGAGLAPITPAYDQSDAHGRNAGPADDGQADRLARLRNHPRRQLGGVGGGDDADEPGADGLRHGRQLLQPVAGDDPTSRQAARS
ncbi:MAG: flagellar basal body protein [Caulobacteraceae bacterium]